jgi:hypothetical protein
VRNENGTKDRRHSSVDGDRPRSRKLLGKAKDDILIQPRKGDYESKLNAKEIERARKWHDMALIERPNGTVNFHFPVTKKVCSTTGFDDSFYNERSREYPIVGERLYGILSWIVKPPIAVTAKKNNS